MLLQAEGEASGCPLCRMDVIFDVTLNRTCLQAMRGQHTEGVSFAPMRHPTSSGHAPPGAKLTSPARNWSERTGGESFSFHTHARSVMERGWGAGKWEWCKTGVRDGTPTRWNGSSFLVDVHGAQSNEIRGCNRHSWWQKPPSWAANGQGGCGNKHCRSRTSGLSSQRRCR